MSTHDPREGPAGRGDSDASHEHAPQPGTQVGLGRVVDNASGLGRDEAASPDGPQVEGASEDSFPASDPPGFMTEPATPAGRRIERPDPRDVP